MFPIRLLEGHEQRRKSHVTRVAEADADEAEAETRQREQRQGAATNVAFVRAPGAAAGGRRKQTLPTSSTPSPFLCLAEPFYALTSGTRHSHTHLSAPRLGPWTRPKRLFPMAASSHLDLSGQGQAGKDPRPSGESAGQNVLHDADSTLLGIHSTPCCHARAPRSRHWRAE